MSARLFMQGASLSDTGRRPANDDAVLLDARRGISLICDGARGRFGGRTAAELAIQTIQGGLDEIARRVGERLSPEAERAVEEALFAAHRRIQAAQASDPSLQGMASTAAMVVHRGEEVLVSHVGDSRVYLYRDPVLQQLTRDHNLENYLRDNPNVRPKAQLSGKTLIRALGAQSPTLAVDHKCLTIQKDDVFLICTDGLSDSVPPLTLREILAGVKVSPLEEVATALVRAALSHGSMDNISVVVLAATDAPVDAPKTTVYETDSMYKQVVRIVLGWLVFLDGPKRGEVIPLEASTVIGADPGCRVCIQEPYASGRHAEVFRSEHGFLLRDLGSTNGTFINNTKIKNVPLVDGDVIRVGTTEIIFKSHSLE